MSISELALKAIFSGKEQFDASEGIFAANAGQRALQTGGKSIDLTQNATSTPKINKSPIVLELTTNGGTQTLDLTAVQGLVLPTGLTRTLDMTNAKLVAAWLEANSANDGDFTLAPGAATPYPISGAGNSRVFNPGEVGLLCFRSVASAKPTVSGTEKHIDYSGGTGRKLYVELYFGVP